jgi:LuxR family transcriptional regulator, maltose regulon positive regulatory protein
VPVEGLRPSSPERGAVQVVLRPALFERLGAAPRVTVVSAPPGSGKTVLLRSWSTEAGLAGHTAWVPVGRDERDPQRFWLSVLQALRRTGPGGQAVRGATAAPGLDGWALVERLLEDLATLEERLWLVVDDVHELSSTEVLRQLELLVMRAPLALRFVLATRHDVRLGLHRLRLEGELAEVRAADLRFSVAEAGELLKAAGVDLPGPALVALHERTEGWAAGLRLAALSLSGHPDPERFAHEFSGSERTVADYLLAEVLERQSGQVRRLLLRTSVLERVNGELADLLTGDEGGEAVLQDLERANAFVVSLGPARSWFRYHQLFADLLVLELRRTAAGEVSGLHQAAARWLAEHGYPVEAVRHAQAAHDFGMAARLLADHYPDLLLDGQRATVHELLSTFPNRLLSADAELAVLAASDELVQGSLKKAELYLGLADQASPSVSPDRRGQLRLLRGVVSPALAFARGDAQAGEEEAQHLQAMAAGPDVAEPTLGEDLRALALISLGRTEFWATGQDTKRSIDSGLALARRAGRPYLEFAALAHQSAVDFYGSFQRAAEGATAAIELAERHGWGNEAAFGVACMVLGAVLVWQGRLDEAEPWVERTERAQKAESHPVLGLSSRRLRGELELARHRYTVALAAFQSAEPLATRLVAPHHHVPEMQAMMLHTLVRLGDAQRGEQILAGLSPRDSERVEIRIAAAALRVAQGDQQAALAALAPVLDRPGPVWRNWLATAYTLEAVAEDALGDQASAGAALERGLDSAEPDGALLPFLLHPAPGLLERHARNRGTHAALVANIQSLLAGATGTATRPRPEPLLEALSDAELRVLRYLPTNLRGPEIARELYVSQNTVKTHIRNLYAKLGAHGRSEAVARARDLSLLAPSGARTKALAPRP